MKCGGIDLGGTKIEARLFDGPETLPLSARRIATPRDSFEALLQALADMVNWLESEADGPIPIGLSMMGSYPELICLSKTGNS